MDQAPIQVTNIAVLDISPIPYYISQSANMLRLISSLPWHSVDYHFDLLGWGVVDQPLVFAAFSRHAQVSGLRLLKLKLLEKKICWRFE
jgi:hypothetical protein